MPPEALAPEEAEHEARVREAIAAEIDSNGGWIGFERYMELALYAPGLGYYSAGARKFGRGGDFVTAPEVSPLFGACVARQCAEVLRELGRGSIMEVGAGSGRLALDVLTRLESLRCLPENYWILEVSGELRERQRRLLTAQAPHLAGRVAWLDEPPRSAFAGVILANEVLDALPVTRFRWQPHCCEEMGVAVHGDSFVWAARPGGPRLTSAADELAAAADGWEAGYVSEYCPRLKAWSGTIAASLRRGAVLWFDYGLPRAHYYLAERHEGTLICHFRHRASVHPFAHPGIQDITAWVDFTALAQACTTAGLELAGFTTQAMFLAGLGVDDEMQAMAAGNANEFARLANQARRLMLPGEMGECFKAMAWTRGLGAGDSACNLSGFSLQDLRHSL